MSGMILPVMPTPPKHIRQTSYTIPMDASREPLSDTELAYGRFVPRQFLHLLGHNDIRNVELGQQVECKMTVLFSDLRDFTALSESMSPQENLNLLNSYLMQMEPVIAAHGGFIDKYIGDAIMALFPDSPDQAVRGAMAMLNKLDEYNAGRQRAGYRPVKIGIGINTGIVIIGTIGGKGRMDGTVIGDAVNLAARLEQLTKDYDVPLLISEYTLYSLENAAPYSIRFLDRTHVRGKQDAQSVYEVFDADPPPLRIAKRENLVLFEHALACYHLDDIAAASTLLERTLEMIPDDAAARVYLERCKQRTSGTKVPSFTITKQWLVDYEIGVTEIDRAHQELLQNMNSLGAAVLAGTSALTPALLDQLELAATTVFNAEESLMITRGYSFTSLHTRQHQRFFEYFLELRREIESGNEEPLYLTFRVKRLLSDWLANHMVTADRHFGQFLRGRTSPRKP